MQKSWEKANQDITVKRERNLQKHLKLHKEQPEETKKNRIPMIMIMGCNCTRKRKLTALILCIATGSVVSTDTESLVESLLIRGQRDVYGFGGGYGGVYGSYAGGTGTGCSCPYVSCDNKSDGLLAFGVGALLGLLLSMLRTMMMTAPAAPTTGRDQDTSQEVLADFSHNVTWARESARMNHPHQSTLLEMLHLPENLEDDLVPVMADLFHIYTYGGKKPECIRRWICEATRQSLEMGGLRAQLGSLSSIAVGWFTKDLAPALQNIFPGSKDLDCKYLSPKCDVPFQHD